MKRSSPSDRPSPEPEDGPSSLFGLSGPSERWMEELRRAEAPASAASLGPYELVEEVARGGQGIVYRALQPATQREVAVKRMLAGSFASEGAQRRFEREVELAAGLDHPGVVTVYGVEEVDGVPLLAMEWVDGQPIHQWARARPRAEVLRLFVAVCDAVQHAHQRGVLHRDLKPSNVLVDASGQPRVLDFGLARPLETTGEAWTRSADFLGTPAYASPEQLSESSEPLDVRTDVYSLGVLLHEMLLGRRPHADVDGLEQLLAIVRSDPPRPSTWDSSLGTELEAILLRALAVERDERYPTVDALGADVRAYLAGEPVQAHPPSAWYPLVKWAKRHRAVSALLVLVFALSLSFSVALALQSARLQDERDELERTQGQEQRARRAAEHAAGNERNLLEFFLAHVIAGANPVVHGGAPSLRDVLDAAALEIDDSFGDDPVAEVFVRRHMAQSYMGLAAMDRAEEHARRAVELAEQHPQQVPVYERAMAAYAWGNALADSGQAAEAERQLRTGLALLDAPESATDVLSPIPNAVRELARAGMTDGLGRILHDLARYEESAACLERALALFERHAPQTQADIAATRAALAFSLYVRGDSIGALEAFDALLAEEEAAGRAGEYLYCDALGMQAQAHWALGEYFEATDCLERALELERARFPEGHPAIAARQGALAQYLALLGDTDRAEELVRQSLEWVRSAPNSNPEGLVAQLMFLANIHFERNQLAQARPLMEEALELRLGFSTPDHPQTVLIQRNLAGVQLALDDLDAAGPHLVAVEAWQRTHSEAPDEKHAYDLRMLGNWQQRTGQLERALASYVEAVDIHEALPGQNPALVLSMRQIRDYAREQLEAERAAQD